MTQSHLRYKASSSTSLTSEAAVPHQNHQRVSWCTHQGRHSPAVNCWAQLFLLFPARRSCVSRWAAAGPSWREAWPHQGSPSAALAVLVIPHSFPGALQTWSWLGNCTEAAAVPGRAGSWTPHPTKEIHSQKTRGPIASKAQTPRGQQLLGRHF